MTPLSGVLYFVLPTFPLGEVSDKCELWRQRVKRHSIKGPVEFNQNRWQCHAGGPGQWPRPNSAGLMLVGVYLVGYQLLSNKCCSGIGKKNKKIQVFLEGRNETLRKARQKLGVRKKMMPRRGKRYTLDIFLVWLSPYLECPQPRLKTPCSMLQ